MAADFSTRIAANVRGVVEQATLTPEQVKFLREAAEWIERQQAEIHTLVAGTIRSGERMRAAGLFPPREPVTTADTARGEV